MRRMQLGLMAGVLSLVAAGAWADVPISIQAQANRALVDNTLAGDGVGGWSDQGKENSLTGFPTGHVTLAGVPFDVPVGQVSAVFLKGKTVNAPNLPERVMIHAPANAKGKTLAVLVTSIGSTNDKTAAEVTVTYANGETEERKLIYGKHVSNWWGAKDLPQAIAAWQGKNGLGNEIGVYVAPLLLRQPNEVVTSVEFKAEPEFGTVAILGLTLSDKTPAEILPKPRRWQPWAHNNDSANWWPLEIPYDNATKKAAWEEGMNVFEKPAGEFGWVKAVGDNFEFEKAPGQRVRFKGICATGSFLYPPASLTPRHATVLAKFGFNQVRYHSIFDELLARNGGYALPKWNEARLAKFDRIFAETKKRGIYTMVSMLFATRWDPSTGVPQADQIATLNNTQYFYDSKHQDLYMQMLWEFLEHKNPYTGLRYADDPAMAMIKSINEVSVFFYTVDAMPGAYRIALQDKYNAWLKAKYRDHVGLVTAWRVADAGQPIGSAEDLDRGTVALIGIPQLANCPAQYHNRAADQTQFYMELEQTFYKRFEETVRATGSKAMLQGSSWGGPGYLQEIQTASNAMLDYTGKHTYWLHPSGGWNIPSALFGNESVEKNPDTNLFTSCFMHVVNKPFAVTEWQFCLPNDYINEGPLFMAAYGAMQNMTASHRFNLDSPEFSPDLGGSFFNNFSIHGAMSVEPMAYFVFVRGDVAPAPVIYVNSLSPKELHDSDRKKNLASRESSNRFFMLYGGQSVPPKSMAVGGVRVAFDEKAFPDKWDDAAYKAAVNEKEGVIISNTGELKWNYKRGFVQIRTAKTRGMMGFLSDQQVNDGPLAMKLNSAYGVAGFSSIENKPLDEAGKILITAVGRQRNTGETFDELMQGDARVTDQPPFRIGRWGTAPVIMEPVTIHFELATKLDGSWRLVPLDINGYPEADKATAVTVRDGKLTGDIDTAAVRAMTFVLERK